MQKPSISNFFVNAILCCLVHVEETSCNRQVFCDRHTRHFHRVVHDSLMLVAGSMFNHTTGLVIYRTADPDSGVVFHTNYLSLVYSARVAPQRIYDSGITFVGITV